MNDDSYADRLAAFHRRLVEGDMPENIAGVLTIDLAKSILARTDATAEPDPVAVKSAVAAAAEAKRLKRAEEVTK